MTFRGSPELPARNLITNKMGGALSIKAPCQARVGAGETYTLSGLWVPGRGPGKTWMRTVAGLAASLPRMCGHESAAMRALLLPRGLLMSMGPGDKSPGRCVWMWVPEALMAQGGQFALVLRFTPPKSLMRWLH